VERLEGEAGPNAILYGVGGPGGQVNYITKRAQDRNFVRVRGRTSSYGTWLAPWTSTAGLVRS